MSKLYNFQNLPRGKKYRNMIVPRRDGEILVAADLSQAEARIVAWKAKDKTMMDLFRSGRKIHEYAGTIILAEKITKATHPAQYEAMKRTVHAYDYGMRAKKLSEVLLKELDMRVPVEVCEKYLATLNQIFPGIRTGFQMGIEQELKQNMGVLVCPPLGWQRKFYTPWGDDLLRQAYAHYPQHVVAFLTNQALNRLYYDEGYGDYLYMQIHDEIVLSVPEDIKDAAVRTLCQAMTYELEINGEKLVVPVEPKVGWRLGEMEAYIPHENEMS